MPSATTSVSCRGAPRCRTVIVLLLSALTCVSARADQNVDDGLIQEAYQRMHVMVRASHILLASPRPASAEMISMTTQFANTLKQSIERGERSFEEAARLFSDDPSVATNQGDLGYFTVFEQPYAIESAAYRTAVDAVSEPVRSRFGVHLVMPTARVPVGGIKTVAHIMLRHGNDARQRIDAIRRTVSVDNFSAVANSLSEDLRSRGQGGLLGTDRLVDSLEAVRLKLDPGVISAPVESPSGWHILMVTTLEPFPSVSAIRQQLLERILRDGRRELFRRR